MIVVDTTVWIDFLEARGTPFDRHLTALLEDDAPLALVDIVYCEVLQGIRDDDVYSPNADEFVGSPDPAPAGSRDLRDRREPVSGGATPRAHGAAKR